MNWSEFTLIVVGIIALSMVALWLRPAQVSIYTEEEI